MDAGHPEVKTGNGFLPLDTPSFPKWLDFVDYLAGRVIGALVTAFWWAVWIDSSMFQDSPYLNIGLEFALGPGMTLISMLIQQRLKTIHSRQGFITRHLIVVVYTYVMAISAVNTWLWLWTLLDKTAGVDYLAVGVSLGASLLVLAATRRTTLLVNVPSTASADLAVRDAFEWETVFNQQPGTPWHVADCLFTIMVVMSASTIVWRGWWDMLDLIMFPGRELKSCLYGLIISQCLDVVFILMTNQTKKMSIWFEKRHWLSKLIFEDIIACLHFASCNMFWRGIWGVLDFYIKEPSIRFCVFHAGTFVILVLMFASSSIAGQTCPQDGALSDGQGVVFNSRYVTDTLLAYHRWKMGKKDSESSKLGQHQESVKGYNTLSNATVEQCHSDARLAG